MVPKKSAASNSMLSIDWKKTRHALGYSKFSKALITQRRSTVQANIRNNSWVSYDVTWGSRVRVNDGFYIVYIVLYWLL
jgi:hypothetical protein